MMDQATTDPIKSRTTSVLPAVLARRKASTRSAWGNIGRKKSIVFMNAHYKARFLQVNGKWLMED
jgi:hypothetical protein